MGSSTAAKGLALALLALCLSCSSDERIEKVAPSPPPSPPAVAQPAEPVPAPKAKLTRLEGDVMVKRAAADDWARATVGLELFENDKVRTAAGSSASLEFKSGTVSIGGDALLSVAESKLQGRAASDLTLLQGRANAEVPDPENQSLTVTTPAATVHAGREIVFQ